MFTRSAAFYEPLYAFKDYEGESRRVIDLIERHRSSPGRSLLDVACGTGGHIEYLKGPYDVTGLDLDEEMLAVARGRHPGIPFHRGDMASFDLGRRFDAVICLFSSIGYVRTEERLRKAVAAMRRHLLVGGVLVLEPWLTPSAVRLGIPHALFVDRPELKIARLSASRVEGTLSIIDFDYLVGTGAGVDHFTERHELGLFTHEQYMAAVEATGLKVTYDPEGLTGRGLYVGEALHGESAGPPPSAGREPDPPGPR